MPLSEVENTLSALLASCSSAIDTHPCIQKLVSSLKSLHSQDLQTFVERQLTGRDFDLNEALVLVDALSYLGSGNFSRVLSQFIHGSQSEVSEELALKILFHLTSGRLQPDRY